MNFSGQGPLPSGLTDGDQGLTTLRHVHAACVFTFSFYFAHFDGYMMQAVCLLNGEKPILALELHNHLLP